MKYKRKYYTPEQRAALMLKAMTRDEAKKLAFETMDANNVTGQMTLAMYWREVLVNLLGK